MRKKNETFFFTQAVENKNHPSLSLSLFFSLSLPNSKRAPARTHAVCVFIIIRIIRIIALDSITR